MTDLAPGISSSTICDLSFYRKKLLLVICGSYDLWLSEGRRRLEVEEWWRLLDLNLMMQKYYVLKLHKTHSYIVDRLIFLVRKLTGIFSIYLFLLREVRNSSDFSGF